MSKEELNNLILEKVDFQYSDYPNLLDNVCMKCCDLTEAIIDLRDRYREETLLPLNHAQSDVENLLNMINILEAEILKYSDPVLVNKTYIPLSIDRIMDDPDLKDEFQDWIDELRH